MKLLKNRGGSGPNTKEGGVGLGGEADQMGATNSKQRADGSWRDKAAERLGLLRTGRVPDAGKSADGGKSNRGEDSAEQSPASRQIPPEVEYRVRRPGGAMGVGKVSGKASISPDEVVTAGKVEGATGKASRGDQTTLAAAAASDPLRCQVTMPCHVCPEAAMRDNAEYCLPTGWRQQVRCKNAPGVEDVRFEACK